MVTLNPRRNPIKNNLKEFEYYEFDKFIVLDKSKKRQVMPYLALNAWDKFYYVAPFDLKAWTKMILIKKNYLENFHCPIAH